MAVDYKLIGNRIISERTKKKITQEKLAEYLDVSVGYISQLERGITKISLDRLSEISDYLDCSITYFLSGSSISSSDYLLDDINQQLKKMSSQHRILLYQILKLIEEQAEKS